MKIWEIVKGVIYTIIAALIVAFAPTLIEEQYIKFLVGGLMVFYGVPEIIICSLKKKSFEMIEFYWACIEFVLGTIILLSEDDYVAVCSGWAIWSILRESFEIKEAVESLKEHRPGILSIIESIVCIVFAVMLLYNPTKHHAMVHARILLPIELVTTGTLFPLLRILFEKVIHKNIIPKENE